MSFEQKRAIVRRRTATSVFAGDFDVRPPRDALTSLLNGVGVYKLVERDDESRRTRRRERRERDRERKRAKARERTTNEDINDAKASTSTAAATTPEQHVPLGPAPFWRARPAIRMATMQRSVSVTPPPMPQSPPSRTTRMSPSGTSHTSRTSSKRPRTPNDDEELIGQPLAAPPSKRRKRVAVRKGWKGWVEGSPPPSEKLINLDAVPVLQERRTRSGKSFDAIGVGKDGWV